MVYPEGVKVEQISDYWIANIEEIRSRDDSGTDVTLFSSLPLIFLTDNPDLAQGTLVLFCDRGCSSDREHVSALILQFLTAACWILTSLVQ